MMNVVRFLLLVISVITLGKAYADVPIIIIARVRAENLRPTQALIGLDAVNVKAAMLGKMSKKERIKYLSRHPVPVVIGPGSQLYMIDHHHLSRALLISGHHRLFANIIDDWSWMDEAAFWNRMEEKKWAYLFDESGNPLTPAQLPENVMGLKDDRYRSLAYFAREKGAYEKTPTPFAEFQWAGYYRLRLPDYTPGPPTGAELKQALAVSQEPETIELPGSHALACYSLFIP